MPHPAPKPFLSPDLPAVLPKKLVLPEAATTLNSSSSWPEVEAAKRTGVEKVYEARTLGMEGCQEEKEGGKRRERKMKGGRRRKGRRDREKEREERK